MHTPKTIISELIDHINGDKSDDRIENLRPATYAENARNKTIQRNNKTGLKGVSFNPRYKMPWVTQISLNGQRQFYGRFMTKEEAAEAYKENAKKLHGQFYRQE